MRELWLACGMLLLLIVAVCLGGAQRKEHFAQDKTFDGEKLDRVVDDVYRNLNIGFTTDASFYEWIDTGRTDAGGYDTLYLPFKYANTDYFIGVMTTTVAMPASGVLSDSSFWVALWGASTFHPNLKFTYYTVGAK